MKTGAEGALSSRVVRGRATSIGRRTQQAATAGRTPRGAIELLAPLGLLAAGRRATGRYATPGVPARVVSRAMRRLLGQHADAWRDCYCSALGGLRVGAA